MKARIWMGALPVGLVSGYLEAVSWPLLGSVVVCAMILIDTSCAVPALISTSLGAAAGLFRMAALAASDPAAAYETLQRTFGFEAPELADVSARLLATGWAEIPHLLGEGVPVTIPCMIRVIQGTDVASAATVSWSWMTAALGTTALLTWGACRMGVSRLGLARRLGLGILVWVVLYNILP